MHLLPYHPSVFDKGTAVHASEMTDNAFRPFIVPKVLGGIVVAPDKATTAIPTHVTASGLEIAHEETPSITHHPPFATSSTVP